MNKLLVIMVDYFIVCLMSVKKVNKCTQTTIRWNATQSKRETDYKNLILFIFKIGTWQNKTQKRGSCKSKIYVWTHAKNNRVTPLNENFTQSFITLSILSILINVFKTSFFYYVSPLIYLQNTAPVKHDFDYLNSIV